VFAVRESPDSHQRVEFIATPPPGVDLDKLARLGDLLQDMKAGILATVVKIWVPELNLVLVILSGVAIILPGYTISLGIGELVAQHIASGAANLMNGLICLFKQVAGGWLGVIAAGSVIPLAAVGPANPVEQVWMWLLVPKMQDAIQ